MSPVTPTIQAGYVSADEYVELALLRISGRTLKRYCDDNRHLAEGIGELRTLGKRLYDCSTAQRFRQIYQAAERKRREEEGREQGKDGSK